MPLFLVIELTPSVAPVAAALRSLRDRRAVNFRVGIACEMLAREWTRTLARSRHDTARRLGAKQTKFVTDALWRIRSKSNQSGVELTFDHPWFARAFGDVDITPKRAKYLTIPIHKWGYGRRAKEVEADGRKLFVMRTPKGLFLAHKADNNRLVFVYQLVLAARQKQEPERLPSAAEFGEVSEGAARDAVRALFPKRTI